MRMNSFSRSSRAIGPNTRAPRVAYVADEHAGIFIESNDRAIGSSDRLFLADDDCTRHRPFLNGSSGGDLLYRHYDHVADRGIPAAGAAQNADAFGHPGAGVISNF